MNTVASSESAQWQDLWYIVRRNVFLVTNGIIAAVSVLLLIVRDYEAGIFLGMVLLINMTLGLAQDIRAWYALRALQLLTAPHVLRISPDGREESVLTSLVGKGEKLRLRTGDEVPCDGRVLGAHSLEINEGLLTGEAASLPRKVGDRLLGGSIITAGTGVLETETVFQESRIARMTEGIQGYTGSESPIQKAVHQVVRSAGYVLMIAIVFVVGRGLWVGEETFVVIKNVGALTSALVPQGLIFALTLLFAYGAAHLFRRNVLLQEVNATEKLGRIRNLCMDKTGTLTELELVVEKVELPEGITEKEMKEAGAAYVAGAHDVSQMIQALAKYLRGEQSHRTIAAVRAFSSWRAYGAVETRTVDGKGEILLVGSGESLSSSLPETERAWLTQVETQAAQQGKRLFCLARAAARHLPDDLTQVQVSLLGIFVLSSRLRPGIPEAIRFFQERGVRIRIISGDHPKTVRSVAKQAGVWGCEHGITGQEMQHWSEAEYEEKVARYTIFARIMPEQKERIIEALKKSGFTAMVGDGANDALAIKKADLGIAMFEGAAATRKLASVVLMNNSFTALPGGVELAESIIKNAEIFASLFLGTALTSLLFFLEVSVFGYHFPLTPLNLTLINYFTVGLPGILVSYWTIRPTKKAVTPDDTPFLQKVAPFMCWSMGWQALVLFGIFFFSPPELKIAPSNALVLIASIVVGYVFFLFAPRVYRGKLSWNERRDLIVLSLVELLVLWGVFRIAWVLRFFEVTPMSLEKPITQFFLVALGVYSIGQAVIARVFSGNSLPKESTSKKE